MESFLLLALRNLVQAEQNDLTIQTLCKSCFGALKQADYFFKNDSKKREMAAAMLQKEGLQYNGTARIKHLLTVLDEDIGPDIIKSQIKREFKGLKIAPNYGCHALRPSNITEFDFPHAPQIFERIIRLTGAETLDWSRRLECCGHPLQEKNKAMANAMFQKKMVGAREAGADIMCSACNYCQIQFNESLEANTLSNPVPSILISQLLGLSMGVPSKKIGCDIPCGTSC